MSDDHASARFEQALARAATLLTATLLDRDLEAGDREVITQALRTLLDGHQLTLAEPGPVAALPVDQALKAALEALKQASAEAVAPRDILLPAIVARESSAVQELP